MQTFIFFLILFLDPYLVSLGHKLAFSFFYFKFIFSLKMVSFHIWPILKSSYWTNPLIDESFIIKNLRLVIFGEENLIQPKMKKIWYLYSTFILYIKFGFQSWMSSPKKINLECNEHIYFLIFSLFYRVSGKDN